MEQINKNNPNDEIDLSEIGRVIKRRKLFVGITFSLFFTLQLGFTIYQRIFNPIYRGSFKLLISDPLNEQKNAGLGNEMIESLARNETTNDIPTLIELLKSPVILNDLARKSSITSNKRSWISSRSLKNNITRPIKLLSIEIGDNVVSRNIEGKRKNFNTDDKRVYCLTRIENTNDFRTTIFHKWYKDLKLESNILINIGKSYNWRSWSYININSDRVGNWKVVIEDSSGFKYDSLEFSISQR